MTHDRLPPSSLTLALPVVLGVLTALVFLMRALVPGDPIKIMFLGQIPPDPETVAQLRHELGLGCTTCRHMSIMSPVC